MRDPKEVYAKLQDGTAVLIDIREQDELEESGIADGALWYPTSQMDPCSDDWKKFKANLPKDKEIVMYCRSGGRVSRISEFLQQDGYTISNMGGLKDWAAAKLPIKKFSKA